MVMLTSLKSSSSYINRGTLLSDKEQNEAFNKAVKELNRVYTTYGRFATTAGVLKLFDSFGFELSIK